MTQANRKPARKLPRPAQDEDDGVLPRAKNDGASPSADDDSAEEDVEQLRTQLMLKLARLVGEQFLGSCRRRDCRRNRRCMGAERDLSCSNAPPAPPLTPEQDAALRADLWHALQRRLAEVGRETE